MCLYEYDLNPLTRSIKAASDASPLECLTILVPIPTSLQENKLCLAYTAAALLHLDLLYLCRPATTVISNHINIRLCGRARYGRKASLLSWSTNIVGT